MLLFVWLLDRGKLVLPTREQLASTGTRGYVALSTIMRVPFGFEVCTYERTVTCSALLPPSVLPSARVLNAVKRAMMLALNLLGAVVAKCTLRKLMCGAKN